MNLPSQSLARNKRERGDEFVEFALGLPFMMILLIAILGVCLLFFAEGISSGAGVFASRESGISRSNNAVFTGAGYGLFTETTATVGGGGISQILSGPVIGVNYPWRQVRVNSTGSIDWSFGGLLLGSFDFSGGGASRIHQFYPGPPDPGGFE
jgi:hypothetical protein